jgi:hypothetical protein
VVIAVKVDVSIALMVLIKRREPIEIKERNEFRAVQKIDYAGHTLDFTSFKNAQR